MSAMLLPRLTTAIEQMRSSPARCRSFGVAVGLAAPRSWSRVVVSDFMAIKYRLESTTWNSRHATFSFGYINRLLGGKL